MSLYYDYKEDAFMNVFDRITANEIKRFAIKVNNSNADVFLVMARKAICLIDVLIELGYVNQNIKEKTIWTDRVLDMDGLDCSKKRIDIIDDVIISGSTIAKAINKLCQLGCEENNINIIVLAINTTTFRMDLGSFLKRDSYMQLKEEECIELSSDIAKSLNVLGHPYDIDFPAYKEIIISKNNYKKILLSSNYSYYEVHNTNHIQNNVSVLTFIPNKETISLFWGKVDEKIKKYFHIKLRIFSRPIVGTNNIRIQIVPMVIIQEMQFETLIELFNLLNLTQSLEKSFKTLSSKTRLIQYFIAIKFFEFYYIENISESLIFPDRYKMSLIFGKMLINDIENLIIKDINVFNNIKFQSNFNINVDMLGFSSNLKSDNNYDMTERLVEPFEYWYNTAEKGARRILKSNGISYKDDSIINSLNRLDKGFSFAVLKNLIIDTKDKYNIDAMVSIFIDRAVDLGMIVPILYENNGIICRAYRHGEDFPFTKQDRERLKYFLKVFFEGINNSGIAKIPTEKIIVMFLQLGSRLEYSLLNQFKDFDNDGQLLTVKYCIHGAVTNVVEIDTEDSIKPYVIQSDYSRWLSEKFILEGVLKKIPIDKNNTRFHITYAGEEIDTISEKAKASIEEIAELLANWYNYSAEEGKISKFTDYVTALTACVTEEMFASAILAELYISTYDWDKSMKPALESDNLNRIEKIIVETRKNTNQGRSAFVAMNSGRMKYLYYERNFNKDIEFNSNKENINNIIDNVYKLFDNHNDNFKRVWNRLWANYKEAVQSDTEVTKYVKYCVRYIYLFNICYRLIELLFIYGVKNDDSIKNPDIIINEIEELLNEYKGLLPRTEKISPEDSELYEEEIFIQNILKKLDKKFDFLNEKNKIIIYLDNMVLKSFDVRKKVEENIQANRPMLVEHQYDSAIVFDVISDYIENIRNIIENICSEYNDIDFGIMIFNNEYTNDTISRIVIFSNHFDKMIDISIMICQKLLNGLYKFRTVIIPKLGSQIIKLWPWGATKNNNSKFKFYKNVIIPIDNHLKNKHNGDYVYLIIIKNYDDYQFQDCCLKIIKCFSESIIFPQVDEIEIAIGQKEKFKCGIEVYVSQKDNGIKINSQPIRDKVNIQIANIIVNQKEEEVDKMNNYTQNAQQINNIEGGNNQVVFTNNGLDYGLLMEELEKLKSLSINQEEKFEIENAINATKEKSETKLVTALKKIAGFSSNVLSKITADVIVSYMKAKGIIT